MENKTELKEETCNCICKSKSFRNFLIVAGGTFVGAFCALSLFVALHKPPMPMPYPAHGPYMRPMIAQPHHFYKHHKDRKEFYKKMEHKKFDKKAPVKMDKDMPQ